MRIFRNCFLLAAVCALSLMVQGLAVAHAEMYDLSQTKVRYTSEGSTYILSWESPARSGTSSSVTVSRVETPHGKYILREEVNYDSVSFDCDYDGYYIYDADGPEYQILYNYENDAFRVTYLRAPDAYTYSGTYVYSETYDRYMRNGHSIEPCVAELVKGGDVYPGRVYQAKLMGSGNGIVDWMVELYPKEAQEQKSSDLPDMWYKMMDEYDPDEWVAFTYDQTSGVFTMYRPTYEGKIEKYSYRKFLDDNTLQVGDLIGNYYSSAKTGIYKKDIDGHFSDESGYGPKTYITDGMLIFLHQCVK